MSSARRRSRKRRIAAGYALGAVVLIGWAAYLGVSLPDRNIAQHWNAAWVGLDVLIVVALASTAWCAAHSDRHIVLSAAVTAGLLVADAWMDMATATRSDLWQSTALALFVELPLATGSILLARRALDRVADPMTRRRRPTKRDIQPSVRHAGAAPKTVAQHPDTRPSPRDRSVKRPSKELR